MANRGWIALSLAVLIVGISATATVAEDFGVSFQATTTFMDGDDMAEKLNDMNRGDNPFSPLRMLLLAQGKANDKTTLFLEIPVDMASVSSTFLTYLRPFVRVQHLGDQPWLNLQAGKLPTRFGAYGERSNSTGNAMMSVPLMFFYHTAVRSEIAVAGPDYFFADGVRGKGYDGIYGGPVSSFQGVPLAYDACWDIGGELYGAYSGVQYSLSGTLGSVSRPAATENPNEGYGLTGRLGYLFTDGPLFGLRLGASGSVAPYLRGAIVADPLFPSTASPEDFLNTGWGTDLTYARGPWQLFSEAARIGYEVPNIAETLTADSYYVEVVRKLGPTWSLGARQEGIYFSDLEASDGRVEPWDHNLNRTEFSLSYRFRYNTQLRAGYQRTRFPDASEFDADLFALQLQVWTR